MLLFALSSLTSPAAARVTTSRVVRYFGYSVRVPKSWPVYDLAREPQTCVRFDRHAVYLGVPSSRQRCPAHAVGRTESLLLSPLTLSGRAAGGSAPTAALPSGPGSTTLVTDHARLLVTATWDRSPATVQRALGVHRLVSHAGSPSHTGRAAAHPAVLTARTTAARTGLGFDPCSTPSSAALSAWSVSPYRNVGVYLGGANMACAQPNLTASWVSGESAAGWRFIPTYVGLQAPTTSCSCATISPSSAASEGRDAAEDAISNAQGVGLGAGNPIYFDMEAYETGGSATQTVLTFLSAWTSTLHAAGYLSGVYSSGASGISDMVNAQGTSFLEPDDIWIANWNGEHTTSDPYVPSSDWTDHQRIHQYSGDVNETYGGVTMNIDGDYLDGAAAPAQPLIPDGTFVQISGEHAVSRIAGGSPLKVSSWSVFGGPQPLTVIARSVFHELNPVPTDGTFLTTPAGNIYRVAGGAALPVSGWSVFGGPQASVTIDPWDLANTANAAAHLRTRPATGTIVEGLPSKTYWHFVSSGRYKVSPTGAAVPVDDQALRAYHVVPAPRPGCTVPQLHRMTLAQAKRALSRAHCRLGTVHRPVQVSSAHVLRVHSQSSHPHARHSYGFKVRVTLL